MQSNTCLHHVFTIAGLMRHLERQSDRSRITHHFRPIEMTPPGTVADKHRQIVDDLLYSAVATALYLS
jgi:hypothetical protein